MDSFTTFAAICDTSWGLILMLPAHALRQLADDLESKAREARARAAALEASQGRSESRRRRRRERRALFESIAAGMIQRIDEGWPQEAAIAAARQEFGLEAEHLRDLLRTAQRTLERRRRVRRNRRMLKLRAEGKSDVEIGAAVGLHPKSVNRILSEALDEARRDRKA